MIPLSIPVVNRFFKKMIGEKENDEPEVFTSTCEDEMKLFGYLYSVDRKTA